MASRTFEAGPASATKLMSRSGLSEADARQWVANQMPPSEKAALATVVVHNDATVDELRQAVLEAWSEIEF